MGLRLGPRYGGTTVRLRGAAHCRIERNHFRDVGGNALYLEDENERNLVSRNEFSGAGFAGLSGRQPHPVAAPQRMGQPYGDTDRCGHVIRFNYIADIYGLVVNSSATTGTTWTAGFGTISRKGN